ncbi:hypothetical protein EYF80_011818 [Liparis tanakae]|uniref:Uncharacterized protein n=1 Tax=Liparis tanakae TaxID=230148 RepID=A0A4Z2IKQ0_9TELE|nr:hypothetical protein EYF80_011818 [Liparis tanakae]
MGGGQQEEKSRGKARIWTGTRDASPPLSHHVMRPAATADQVTQQELVLLLSSSSSLWQQHKQLR